MQSRITHLFMLIAAILLMSTTACTPSTGTAIPASPTPEQSALIPVAGPLNTAVPPTLIPITSTAAVIHTMTPATPRRGKITYDVESAGTAPEKRAPYGDSFEINRLERPFTQDMSYIPALDIVNFTVAKDNDWWYVSIELNGMDPANTPEINYGVELDLDHDGYGDYLIWAHPPYTNQWDTAPIQIYQDQNHNTSGLSAGKSDVPFTTDGYETLVFDGATSDNDPDTAWIRVETGSPATVQFAFKKSWSGTVFMLGVIADAGWKDPKKLDYIDRLPIAEAGSPVKENIYYPLKALSLVDNTCREAFGFEPTRYELQLCPIPVAPTKTPDPSASDSSEPGTTCSPPAAAPCKNGWDPVNCRCR